MDSGTHPVLNTQGKQVTMQHNNVSLNSSNIRSGEPDDGDAVPQFDAHVLHATPQPIENTRPPTPSGIHSHAQIRQGNCEHERLSTQLSYLVTAFSLLFVVANIGCLSAYYRGSHSDDLVLPNGDHMSKCADRPQDLTCFEMHDLEGRTIYRSEGRKRVLALYKCGENAPETERHKCVGEYAFTHNTTLVWFHRLYFDKETNDYSLISGPVARDTRHIYPRVRHMLSEPYNWIISYDAVPANDFPQSSLYVSGTVVVEDAQNVPP